MNSKNECLIIILHLNNLLMNSRDTLCHSTASAGYSNYYKCWWINCYSIAAWQKWHICIRSLVGHQAKSFLPLHPQSSFQKIKLCEKFLNLVRNNIKPTGTYIGKTSNIGAGHRHFIIWWIAMQTLPSSKVLKRRFLKAKVFLHRPMNLT